MMQLDSRHVIVTGAAQGIGAAIAQRLAERGAHVHTGDIQAAERTIAAIEAAGGSASCGYCDIASAESIDSFVAGALAERGDIHGLVSNAALFSTLRPKPFGEITADEFDRVLQVNVRGTFEMIKAVVPSMRERGYGKIVTVGSSSVLKGAALLAQYVSSKGAVHALTRALSRELGPDGIRINCLAPGLTLSDGVRDAGYLSGERISADAATRSLAREQTPHDLAGAAAFLLSADSDFMTGQLAVVYGGSMLN
ncbi:SDR family NAD(P)-dependent oxidoreductase [Cryptosporangium sp. NPDC048952]|uniref:SDR family NAD(P)-dependent oxidoreductase n=1 Tax=Cryptosporangium sp. NPDC048952 TaxID=3363961 RepID=UPI003712FBFC